MSMNKHVIKALAAITGATLAGGVAFAATNWVVGLTAGSTASAQAASISNISIAQVTPVGSLTNQLYPSANGDIQLKITNPNAFPVTITAITTPSTQAVGYSDSGLTTTISLCSGSTSLVTWAGTAGSHTLTTPLVVAANNAATPLVVTLINEAAMGANTPAACAGAFFQMPSLTGVAATGGAATATTSPATDTYS